MTVTEPAENKYCQSNIPIRTPYIVKSLKRSLFSISECMAPPSYEEVVGVHYPNFQAQPITTPITSALAQTSAESATETRSNDTGTVTRTANETIVNVPRPVAATS